jgi:hypothetical protein
LSRAAEGSALEGVLLRRRNRLRATNQNLGTLEGTQSSATAINDVGQVVGAGNTTTRYQSHMALVNPT